jgi:CheY-like chemotaxis protein
MSSTNINILLADDDNADCLLFKDALEELPISATLSIVNDGEQLIEELKKKTKNCQMFFS